MSDFPCFGQCGHTVGRDEEIARLSADLERQIRGTKVALDEVDRLKAEVERLKAENETLKKAYSEQAKAGREEALELIMRQDAEKFADEMMGSKSNICGDYDTFWHGDRLRKLLKIEKAGVFGSELLESWNRMWDAILDKDEASEAENIIREDRDSLKAEVERLTRVNANLDAVNRGLLRDLNEAQHARDGWENEYAKTERGYQESQATNERLTAEFHNERNQRERLIDEMRRERDRAMDGHRRCEKRLHEEWEASKALKERNAFLESHRETANEEIERLTRERDDARKHADSLTGEKFSDRNHTALQDRARRAEAELRELRRKCGEWADALGEWENADDMPAVEEMREEAGK